MKSKENLKPQQREVNKSLKKGDEKIRVKKIEYSKFK